MTFRYRSHQIAEIIKAVKVVREGQTLEFRKYGERGRALLLELDLTAGMVPDLRLSVKAGRFDDPTTYTAALILADQRVRGIDYSATSRARFYKVRIPQGWHENLIDPNLATHDPQRNRHEALAPFDVTDLRVFLHEVCRRWHIELAIEEALL